MTTVYFDYACEYTYRLHRLMEMAEAEADWQPFSLDQANRADGQAPVWELRPNDVPIGVLALAGHEFVLAQGGPGIRAYRYEAFRLFHAEADRPEARHLWKLIEKYTGYGKEDLDLDGALARVRESHELAVSKRVYGSPTVFIGTSDKPYFVRLEAIPETIRTAKSLWNGLPRASDHFPQPVVIEAVE